MDIVPVTLVKSRVTAILRKSSFLFLFFYTFNEIEFLCENVSKTIINQGFLRIIKSG